MINAPIQLIVAAHGDLACALLRSMELIAGPQAGVACVPLAPGEGVDSYESRMAASLRPAQPCLILVDLAGGTPWNVALGLAARHASVRVVGGANLPMLLEVALSRQGMSVDQLAELAAQTGAQSARIAGR